MSYDLTNYPQLGFAVAAAAPIAAATGPAAPFVLAASLIATALPAVLPKIGAGRKEADVIGPEQTKLTAVLTDVDTILRTQSLSSDDLQQLAYQLNGAWQTFLNFIYQDALISDGDQRASDGARATMEPQVQMRLDTIINTINAILGRPQPAQLIQGGSNVPSLQFRTTTDLSLPQAGFNQPGSFAPAGLPVTAPVNPSGIDSGLMLKLAVAGAVVLLISRR